MERFHPEITIETELSRDLGLVSVLAIGIGTMIAAGIFTLSGLAVREVGSSAIISFLLAALVALFTALSYCEFVSIYPQSGEGYLYARKTFSAPTAFLVGWALFLGYTSSCAFYIASFSSYFFEFIWEAPFESLSGIVALILLTLLNIKGTKESGSFQVLVTVAKVLLLIWFIGGGLRFVDVADLSARLSTDIVKIGGTAALVFITFFGFSAIAASAGEVLNPVKTIPRAIFLSMGIVTVLYTLVILVIVAAGAAGLREYTESAMGEAAKIFLGGVGGMVIVGGGLFSMISASNASIMAGSRVALTMSQLGHFPKKIASISHRTKTPVVALALVGGTILLFAVIFDLENLAHFADTVLLLALIMVNAALIFHRRKYPNIERPFRVPLVPLLPVLGILANLYLLSQALRHPLPVFLAAGTLAAGLGGFFVWRRFRIPEIPLPEEDVFEPSAIHSSIMPTSRFRILVTLHNPATVHQLIDLASKIARDRGGEIVALRVAVVPEQLSPNSADFSEDFYVTREREILEVADRYARENNVPLTAQIDVGHNAARSILETARETGSDLILMGWKGFTTTKERILGEVTDDVVTNAPTDIMLVKLVGTEPLKNWLLPTAGGKHARAAEEYAASIIGEEGRVTVCSVVSPKARDAVIQGVKEMLSKGVEHVTAKKKISADSKIIRHASIARGIIKESKNYDAIMIGATENRFSKILFGSIPEVVAKEADRTVVLVKQKE
ncbi:MAG: amino acid permease [Pyrinomonadaceae bacterium]